MKPASFFDKSGRFQKIIIVGITYDDQDLSTMTDEEWHFNFRKNRMRDYLATEINKSVEKFKKKGVTAEMFKDAGQAEKFKKFIETELIPYINKNYRTNGENDIGGISNGGHFVLWMLLNYPKLFQKYIAASPAPWTEGCYLMDQLPKLTTTQKLKLYLSVGSLERGNKDKCECFSDKQEVMNTLNAEIVRHQNIESKFEIFEGYDHQHACAVGLIMGMNYIFAK